MAYRMPRILAPAVLLLVTASATAGQTPDSLATALQIPAPAARSEGVLALYGNPAGLAFGPTVEAGMAFAGLTSSAWRSRTLMTKLGPFAYGRELFSSGDRDLLNQAFGIGLRLGPRLAVGWGREWRSGRENVTSVGFLFRRSAVVLASDLRSWEFGGIAYAAHRYGVSAELFRGAVWLGWQYEDTYTEGRRGEKPLHLFETVYLSLRPLKGLSLTVRHSPESWYAGLGIGMGRLSAGGWYGADRDTEAKAGQISWLTVSDRNYETILPRRKRWVSLRLGALPPEEPTRLFGIFTLEKETLLDLLLFFEDLRGDEAVAGVILDLRGLSGGWAGLQEVREALVHLKDAGKEVLAYGESPGMGALYVAGAADSLFVPPSGMVNLTGLAYQLPFYADLFEKIGVRAEFVRIDQYKTAPETYTRSEPSAANIDMLYWLLDSLELQFFYALSDG